MDCPDCLGDMVKAGDIHSHDRTPWGLWQCPDCRLIALRPGFSPSGGTEPLKVGFYGEGGTWAYTPFPSPEPERNMR